MFEFWFQTQLSFLLQCLCTFTTPANRFILYRSVVIDLTHDIVRKTYPGLYSNRVRSIHTSPTVESWLFHITTFGDPWCRLSLHLRHNAFAKPQFVFDVVNTLTLRIPSKGPRFTSFLPLQPSATTCSRSPRSPLPFLLVDHCSR